MLCVHYFQTNFLIYIKGSENMKSVQSCHFTERWTAQKKIAYLRVSKPHYDTRWYMHFRIYAKSVPCILFKLIFLKVKYILLLLNVNIYTRTHM